MSRASELAVSNQYMIDFGTQAFFWKLELLRAWY